ncbi:MAG: hypothetical protein Q7K65_02335 [Candidatus Buchananbacteria bacterium]|nr:hypothetical protein [Candidatus Buchananbacteria bacterium]
MIKILPLLIFIFVLSGCSSNLQTNNKLNITATEDEPNVVYSEPIVDEKLITDLTFNDLSNPNNIATSTSIEKIIKWEGKISNQSQIDGIKFWPYDDEFIKGERKDYEFFWASPEDLLDITAYQHKGKWVSYILKRYDGLTSDQIDSERDIYLVIGKFRGLDCGYYGYEESSRKFCIPLIDIIDIDLLK